MLLICTLTSLEANEHACKLENIPLANVALLQASNQRDFMIFRPPSSHSTSMLATYNASCFTREFM